MLYYLSTGYTMFSSYPQTYSNAYPLVRETVPESKLGYLTNNKFLDYPPLMSDGRSITAAYQPSAVLNNALIEDNGIKSNYEYRKYLTDNAPELMKQNAKDSFNDIGYIRRYTDLSHNSMPYYYKSYLDTAKPAGYQNSDLKELYFSREQLDARRVAPSMYR
jgi:hypothetical protein